MPSYQFTGLVETAYPFNRDAGGQPLGAVQPGDVRDLDKPLDWQWVPAGDGQAAASGLQNLAGSETGILFVDAASPAADGPQPAPPAIVPGDPQSFAVTTD